MTADTPTQDLPQSPPREDMGAAARYERGEIDIFTLVTILPESAIPPALRALYLTAKHVIDAPQFREIADEKKRERETREFLDRLGLWRLQRGESYVAAYQEFQTTGRAIDSVQKNVFESDWFRLLQEQRAREIEMLDEKQRTGRLMPEENDRRIALKRARDGDNQVSENWKSLADDYQKLKARESTGRMSEKELREAETRLKERMFEQLDAASPELRERMLAQLAATDPKFRSEYENRLQAQQPVTYSNAEIGHSAMTTGAHALDAADDELAQAEAMMEDRHVSAAKAEGFDGGIKTGVDARGDFSVAAPDRNPAATPQTNVAGPDVTRTSTTPTAGMA